MKTQTATVKLIQLNTPNKQGLYPIVLRAQWNGRYEKRTGIAVSKRDWNANEMCIRRSYPNYTNLNSQLSSMLQTVLQRKFELELSGEPFTVDQLFSNKPTEINRLDYHYLQTELIKSRSLKLSSAKTYYSVEHSLQQYLGRKQFDITVLDANVCQAYGRYLKNNGHKNSSIFNILARIGAIWNYAIGLDLLPEKQHPFRTFDPRKYYKGDFKKKSIDIETLQSLETLLFNYLVTSKHERFLDHTTDEFTVAMFILGYRFGGLALIDMSNLKKSQVSVIKEGRDSYYLFQEVRRQKTNAPVPIIIKQDHITKPLMNIYLKTKGEYLFPLREHTDNERVELERINLIGHHIGKHLKRLTNQHITYYACRHSFATHYMECNGANPVALATLMGRSLGGIFGYVKSIQTTTEIIKEKQRMGL